MNAEALEKVCPGIVNTTVVEDLEGFRELKCDMEYALHYHPVSAAWQKLQDDLNSIINSSATVGTLQVPRSDAELRVAKCENNRAFTLPLSHADAEVLYKALDPSLVGVEKRGDVLDGKLRCSHEVEIEAGAVALPACLATFDFPDDVATIHTRLCPSAERIEIVPYKLILYGKNDFFVPHRDAMDRVDMLGSISIVLPVEENLVELSESDEYERNRRWGGRVGEPGDLVLYAGYHSSDTQMSSANSLLSGGPQENALTYTVNMNKLCFQEADDGGKTVASTLPINYGAWTGDVLHEVCKVDSGYRAVLVYRIYRHGHRGFFVPTEQRLNMSAQISGLMNMLSANRPVPKLPEMAQGNEFMTKTFMDALAEPKRNYYLGFTLRHAYPPAGLTPSMLKGIDAVLYAIVSYHYKAYLFNGTDVRESTFKDVHHLTESPFERLVFVTQDNPTDVSFYGDETRTEMFAKYPLLVNTAWVQLGYGGLLGGGFCYGNMDCGTDWWYRQAYLVLSYEPSRWSLARNVLLLARRGPPAWRKLDGNCEILEKIVEFI